MKQMTSLFFFVFSIVHIVTTGCSEDDDCQNCEENNTTPTRDLNESPCGNMVYQPLDLEAPTALGVHAKDIFDSVQGSCTTSLSWDATGIMGAAFPSSGTSDVSVTLGLDPTTIEIGQYEFPNADPECADHHITVKGNAAVASADGVFNDSGEVSLIYRETTGLSYIKLEKDINELGGTFTVSGDSLAATMLSYDFVTPGVACVGEILLTGTEGLGDDAAASSMGAIGTWTSTGCPLGEDPIDLNQKGQNGLTALDKINEICSSEDYSAKWEDGAETDFNLTSAVLSIPACTERSDALNTPIDIPVSVTYGTSDNKLGARTVEAHLFVSMDADGAIPTATLYVSDNRACESEGDSISYGFGDCTTLSGITVQLGLTWEQNGGWSISDEGVLIYEYPSGAAPFIGAADRVRTLSVF